MRQAVGARFVFLGEAGDQIARSVRPEQALEHVAVGPVVVPVRVMIGIKIAHVLADRYGQGLCALRPGCVEGRENCGIRQRK